MLRFVLSDVEHLQHRHNREREKNRATRVTRPKYYRIETTAERERQTKMEPSTWPVLGTAVNGSLFNVRRRCFSVQLMGSKAVQFPTWLRNGRTSHVHTCLVAVPLKCLIGKRGRERKDGGRTGKGKNGEKKKKKKTGRTRSPTESIERRFSRLDAPTGDPSAIGWRPRAWKSPARFFACGHDT